MRSQSLHLSESFVFHQCLHVDLVGCNCPIVLQDVTHIRRILSPTCKWCFKHNAARLFESTRIFNKSFKSISLTQSGHWWRHWEFGVKRRQQQKKKRRFVFCEPQMKGTMDCRSLLRAVEMHSSKQDFKCRLWNLKRLQIPTGNIRSFCSGDGLCWLIQASNQSSSAFFINEKKASNVTQGLQTPLEVLNSEKKPMLYFIDSSPWVWRQ